MKARRVLLSNAAQNDLADAHSWHDAIDPLLAERLLLETQAAGHRIAGHPLAYPVFIGTCRRMHLRIFPYYVYYRLEHGSIVIHAILHTHRNPTTHRDRAK